MKTLRNAAILTAAGVTATAIVIMPMGPEQTTTVPGVVVTPQTTTSAPPGEAVTGRATPSGSPSATAAEHAGQAPVPAAPAPTERPAAPAPLAPVPVPVPQAPALGGVCEWDDEEWECDDNWGDD